MADVASTYTAPGPSQTRVGAAVASGSGVNQDYWLQQAARNEVHQDLFQYSSIDTAFRMQPHREQHSQHYVALEEPLVEKHTVDLATLQSQLAHYEQLHADGQLERKQMADELCDKNEELASQRTTIERNRISMAQLTRDASQAKERAHKFERLLHASDDPSQPDVERKIMSTFSQLSRLARDFVKSLMCMRGRWYPEPLPPADSTPDLMALYKLVSAGKSEAGPMMTFMEHALEQCLILGLKLNVWDPLHPSAWLLYDL